MGGVQRRGENVTVVVAGSPPVAAVHPGTNNAGEHAAPREPKPLPQQTLPPLATQASNLFQSVVAFVGDGCGIVDDEEYRRRLVVMHSTSSSVPRTPKPEIERSSRE